MLLLDIGNSRIKLLREKEELCVYPVNDDFVFPSEPFYYICVNRKLQERLSLLPQAKNLAECFDLKTEYRGLGVDRIAACYAVEEGVVVDAGSAITVDLMEEGVHKGGFILPGIKSFEQSFATISPTLAMPLHLESVDLHRLPQETRTALGYAVLKAILLPIEEISRGKKIFICGGDAESLARYLYNRPYEIRPQLLFEGMKKVIKERLC